MLLPARVNKTPNPYLLEIDSGDKLNQSTSRIVRCWWILIGIGDLTKSGWAQSAARRRIRRQAADLEVNIIEGIEEFRAEFEIDALGDLCLLNKT